MKAVVLSESESSRHFSLADVPRPEPGPNDVLIRVHAAGLNPVDYKMATTDFVNITYPVVAGVDAAGTIESLGSAVDGWNKGDRVYFHSSLKRCGAFAEYAMAPQHVIARIPENLSFEEAAALPCAGYTAYQAIHRKLDLGADATVLVQAGAGGVGGYLIQLAKLKGWKVFATGSQVNFSYIQDLGADEVFDYRDPDLVEKVKELTQGRGVDAFFDTVGGSSMEIGFKMLAFNGSFVGIVDVPDLHAHKDIFEKAISIHMIALNWSYLNGSDKDERDLAIIGSELAALAKQGKIRSLVHETVTLEQIPEALHKLSLRHVKGKIVAKII